MSILPDSEFDLEKLFLPAWAQAEPSSAKYAKYEGEEERPRRRDERRGPRPPRREGLPGAPRERNRPRAPRRGLPGFEGRAGRPGAAGRDERGEGHAPRWRQPREQREPPPPLPEVNVTLVPEEKGVELLAKQIKMTGRAYPLFDIAQLILEKPERHSVVFSVKKNAEGQPIQPLFVCALDDTLWLSEDEAIAHVLKKHFTTFYQAERTATEPPKGKYTFVAQCGISGVILGPPNHHDYQNQLRKLHAERFSRMPFEEYKSRVKIVRDEEVVKKWVEDQSWRTEYLCLNLPEPLRLGSMEAVGQHFRETHKESIIKPVETHSLNGAAARASRSLGLARLVRNVWEDQRRFPLQIATVLSQQFAAQGLQFFKVNRTITHVCVTRPHYLDLAATPVSEGVKRIVEYINANPRCSRRQLTEALAPSPAPILPETPAAAEGQPAPPPASAEPTADQTVVIADLHWLVRQGHVLEFANGTLETAKKPIPKPPKLEPKPAEQPAEVAAQPEAVVAPELAVPGPAVEAVELPAQQPEEPAAPSPAEQAAPEPQSGTAPEQPPSEPAKPAEEACVTEEQTPKVETPASGPAPAPTDEKAESSTTPVESPS